jgi:hypothetical protein
MSVVFGGGGGGSGGSGGGGYCGRTLSPPPPTHTYTHARRRSRSLSGSVTFSLACTFLGVTLEDDDLLSHRIGKTLVRDGQFLSATDAGLRIGTGKQTSTAAPQQQAIIHMHFAAYRDACV